MQTQAKGDTGPSRRQAPGIVLRTYQRPIADEVTGKILAGEREVLLAGCPGFGKTEVALEIIGRLIAQGWAKRALVLAHGTTVLRTNFEERLQLRRPDLAPFVSVKIPHQEKAIEGEFDLVVVDEAHEFYGVEDGMVERIIRGTGARARLLITGTPSWFIRRGIKPVAFSLLDLYREGFAADARVMLLRSAYRVTEDQWNEDQELKREFRETRRATDETMERLVCALPTLGQQGSKTIIAARTIEMADQVVGYLRAKHIGRVLCSHQEEGDGGANVDAFKSGAAEVLVVVRRATLGFDMPDLQTFVDLTGSRNPDRIFQMFCRIVRKSAVDTEKRFVKAMPAALSGEELRFFMTGVLQLARRDFFTSWDGGSIWRMKVSVGRATKEVLHGSKQGARRVPLFESGMMVFGDMFARMGSSSVARLGELVGRSLPLEITIGEETLCAKDWAKRVGVSDGTILQRYHAGVRGKELLRPARPDVMVKIGEETMSIADCAARTGIPAATIRSRLQRGRSGKRLVEPIKKAQRKVRIDGKEWTLGALAKHHGLGAKMLHARYVSGIRGKALLAPPIAPGGARRWESPTGADRRRRYVIRGEGLTADEWAERTGVIAGTIRSRWASGVRGVALIASAETQRFVTIGRRTASLRDWATQAGLKVGTLWRRLRRGVRGEALLAPTSHERKAVLIEIDGVTRSARAWAKLCGVSRGTVLNRYKAGVRGRALLSRRVSQ